MTGSIPTSMEKYAINGEGTDVLDALTIIFAPCLYYHSLWTGFAIKGCFRDYSIRGID